MKDDSERLIAYITPNEAIQELLPDLRSRFVARQAIADALHSGDLEAAVDNIYEMTDVDPTEDWEVMKENAVHIGKHVVIDHEFWLMSLQWPDETRHWNWRTGNFVINCEEDPIIIFSGVMLENVQFDRAQVMALVGKTDRSGAGGPRPDRERWAQYWVNFLYDCTQTPMDWSEFENKN